jgi:hypothetical protein
VGGYEQALKAQEQALACFAPDWAKGIGASAAD